MLKIYPKYLIKLFIISNSFGLCKECEDKSVPGRPSDCPILKELCDRPLYKDLMSKECPRTCNLCDLFKIKLCSDNIGPNGISECQKYKERCNDTIWRDFMKKECPLTCGICKQFSYYLDKEKIEKRTKIKKKQKVKTKIEKIKKSPRIRLINFPTMVNSINPNIRPCDDFYDYVCDGFRKSEALELIAGSYGKISHSHRNAKKARNLMIELLNDNKMRPKLKSNPLFNKLLEYYDSCRDLTARNNDKISQLLIDKIVDLRQKMGSQYILNTEWIRENHPIFAIDTVYGFTDIAPFSFTLYKFTTLEIATPTTGKYANDQTIRIYQFILHSKQINNKDINEMRQMLTKLSNQRPQEMAAILPSGLPLREAIEKWLNDFIKVNDKFNEITVSYLTLSYVKYEIKPWKGYILEDQFNNPTISGKFETKTLSEIHSKYTPNVDWPLLLKEYNSDINGDTTVLIKCLKCFEDIYKFITQNSDLIRNYLEMDIIYKYSNALGTEFQGLTWNLNKEPIETYCLMRTATHFGMATDRLFLDFFFEEKTKNDVMDLIIKVKEQFRQIIISEDWMGEKTKRRALNKLEMMKAYSGYFDEFKETERIINENKCYNIINQNKMSFGEIEIAASVCTMKRYTNQIIVVDNERKMLHKLNIKNRQMFEANAFYNRYLNNFIVLAGYLFYPVYDKDMPIPMKLGGVGVVIGHEITHGYDNNGRKFNEFGHNENWWDKQTEIEFERKTQCFIEQYNNFLVRVGEKSLSPIDGKFTLDENLADAGGLKSAYWALKNYIKMRKYKLEDSKIEIHGLEYMTDEQLFFITYAFVSSIYYKDTRRILNYLINVILLKDYSKNNNN
uniref:ShKT domain-containing protein n=1 Tax=Meloidogyne hapla TaxID=6305 RepID=A0A1I8BIM0_MELHA